MGCRQCHVTVDVCKFSDNLTDNCQLQLKTPYFVFNFCDRICHETNYLIKEFEKTGLDDV